MTANIIVFIPFGIYAGVILRGVPMWQKAMTAVVLSAGYEAAQFIFAIGVTDITDVMMNTLGAVIGAAVYEYIYLKLKSDQKTRRFIALCSAASAIPMGAIPWHNVGGVQLCIRSKILKFISKIHRQTKIPSVYFAEGIFQTVKKLIHCEREGLFSTLAFGQSRLRRPDIFRTIQYFGLY